MGVVSAGSRDYIVDESEHFVVLPCIGALVSDYFLIVSKRHLLSAGWLNPEEVEDLHNIIERWVYRLGTAGDHVVVFEHGSYDFRDKGGACYDHAHIHVLATGADPQVFVNLVAEDVILEECSDWISAAIRSVQSSERSYLAMGAGERCYIGNSRSAKSQFFRRHLAKWLGVEDGGWDWLVFPELERVTSMIERFGH